MMKHPFFQLKHWVKKKFLAWRIKNLDPYFFALYGLINTNLAKVTYSYAMLKSNFLITQHQLRNLLPNKENITNNNVLSKTNQKRLRTVVNQLEAAHLKLDHLDMEPTPRAQQEQHNFTISEEIHLPSMHATAANNDNAKLLLKTYAKNPAEALQQDMNGNLPLHIAALNGALANVKILVKDLDGLDKGNNAQNTPLHLAILHEHFKVAEYLLKCTITDKKLMLTILRTQNNYLHQPLHLALLTLNEPLILNLFKLILKTMQETPGLNLSDLLIAEDKFGNSILKLVLITKNSAIINAFLTTATAMEEVLHARIEAANDAHKRTYIQQLKTLTETLQAQQERFTYEELQHSEHL